MKIYLVGGAVRDHVLNIESSDRDWVVVGSTPKQMLEQGFSQVGKDFPVFLHPKTNEEYALARIERKVAAGHKGFICHAESSVTLEQDLSRRDLTINAMAMDDQDRIIDPYNGLQDCENKILRHVSPAFTEDPLRCLRLARFAAQLPGFKVAHETRKLCQTMVRRKDLATLSKPRIWQEWHKAMIAQAPNRFLEEMFLIGALSEKVIQLNFDLLPQNSEQRFALLASTLTNPKRLITTIEPPKYHQELAYIINKHKKEKAAKCGQSWLMVFKDLDAFRRPSRLNDWLQVTSVSPAFSHWKHDPKKILEIFAEMRAIDPSEIVKQGFKGQEISNEIDRKRISIIEKLYQ